MNWLQKNNYIAILFGVTLFIVGYLLITDDGNTAYNEIKIEHGDTLWSLAERYSGEMSHIDWIKTVRTENNLLTENIEAGQELVIPISTDHVYIASDEEKYDSVKVASKNENR